MKLHLKITTLLVGLLTLSKGYATSLSDITPNYLAVKAELFTQTSNAGPVQASGSNGFWMGAYLESASVGAILSCTVTSPNSAHVILQDQGDGQGDFAGNAKYSSGVALDAALTSGTYTLAGQTVHGAYSTTLNITGTFASFTAPAITTITNGFWSGSGSGGFIQAYTNAAATLNWSSSQGANDKIFLIVYSAQTGILARQVVLPGNTTSYTLPILASGTYNAELNYVKVSGSNSSGISGATGYGGYDQQTNFTIVETNLNTSDITPSYFMFKGVNYTQTSGSAPTLGSVSPYYAGLWMNSASSGAILSAVLTAPNSSQVTAADTGDGNGDFYGTGYNTTSEASLNSEFTSGTSSLSGFTQQGYFSAALNISGSFGSMVVPAITTITSGSWSGGAVQVLDILPGVITWNSSARANDKVILQIFNANTNAVVFNTLLSGTTTSYTLPILAGGTYSANLIYLTVTGSNSSSIADATGYSGYAVLNNFTIVETPTPWPNSTNFGRGWVGSSWFGDFNISGYPWIYHNQHGFMYVSGTSPSNIWLYETNSNMGWLWTTSTDYPNVYMNTLPSPQTGGGWMFYEVGSSDPRWFYNWTSAAWQSFNP